MSPPSRILNIYCKRYGICVFKQALYLFFIARMAAEPVNRRSYIKQLIPGWNCLPSDFFGYFENRFRLDHKELFEDPVQYPELFGISTIVSDELLVSEAATRYLRALAKILTFEETCAAVAQTYLDKITGPNSRRMHKKDLKDRAIMLMHSDLKRTLERHRPRPAHGRVHYADQESQEQSQEVRNDGGQVARFLHGWNVTVVQFFEGFKSFPVAEGVLDADTIFSGLSDVSSILDRQYVQSWIEAEFFNRTRDAPVEWEERKMSEQAIQKMDIKEAIKKLKKRLADEQKRLEPLKQRFLKDEITQDELSKQDPYGLIKFTPKQIEARRKKVIKKEKGGELNPALEEKRLAMDQEEPRPPQLHRSVPGSSGLDMITRGMEQTSLYQTAGPPREQWQTDPASMNQHPQSTFERAASVSSADFPGLSTWEYGEGAEEAIQLLEGMLGETQAVPSTHQQPQESSAKQRLLMPPGNQSQYQPPESTQVRSSESIDDQDSSWDSELPSITKFRSAAAIPRRRQAIGSFEDAAIFSSGQGSGSMLGPSPYEQEQTASRITALTNPPSQTRDVERQKRVIAQQRDQEEYLMAQQRVVQESLTIQQARDGSEGIPLQQILAPRSTSMGSVTQDMSRIGLYTTAGPSHAWQPSFRSSASQVYRSISRDDLSGQYGGSGGDYDANDTALDQAYMKGQATQPSQRTRESVNRRSKQASSAVDPGYGQTAGPLTKPRHRPPPSGYALDFWISDEDRSSSPPPRPGLHGPQQATSRPKSLANIAPKPSTDSMGSQGYSISGNEQIRSGSTQGQSYMFVPYEHPSSGRIGIRRRLDSPSLGVEKERKKQKTDKK